MLLVIASAALSGAPLPSFPCAQARTPHERLICGDGGLAAADAALAASYRRARSALTAQGQRQLARSQAGWLKFSRAVCPHDAPTSRWESPQDCLRGEYEQRLHEIDRSVRRLGPFIVLRLDAYAVWPAPPDDKSGGNPGFYTDIRRADWIDPAPLAGGLRQAALRWNAQAALPARWVRHTHARVNSRPEEVDETDFADTSQELEVIGASTEVISSERSQYTYSHGSAHGYGSVHYTLRLTRDGKAVRPEALFSRRAGWRTHLAKRASAFLGRAPRAATIAEPSFWKISGRGAAINFGEVHGYASGDQVLEMSWSELSPYLSPLGRRIARGLRG